MVGPACCADTISGSTCTENQFLCDNGWCIPSPYVCDGEMDCYDDSVPSSDEINCGKLID